MSRPAALQQTLLAYVEAARDALDPTPGRTVAVVPGASAVWDDCCAGQVYSRVASAVPVMQRGRPLASGRVPEESIAAWTVTAAIGMIRCIASVNDQGQPPSAAQVAADGAQMLDDMNAILGVLTDRPETRSILSWVPLQATGGCSGGEWVFTIRLGVS